MCIRDSVLDMTYNVFSGTLNLTQPTNHLDCKSYALPQCHDSQWQCKRSLFLTWEASHSGNYSSHVCIAFDLFFSCTSLFQCFRRLSLQACRHFAADSLTQWSDRLSYHLQGLKGELSDVHEPNKKLVDILQPKAK